MFKEIHLLKLDFTIVRVPASKFADRMYPENDMDFVEAWKCPPTIAKRYLRPEISNSLPTRTVWIHVAPLAVILSDSFSSSPLLVAGCFQWKSDRARLHQQHKFPFDATEERLSVSSGPSFDFLVILAVLRHLLVSWLVLSFVLPFFLKTVCVFSAGNLPTTRRQLAVNKNLQKMANDLLLAIH